MKFRVTEVEATFTPDGWPVTAWLRWDGETLPVSDMGRRWKAEDGIHLLVRVADERVFELHTNGALWRACLISEPSHMV
ncbi:MAG: hypothetical protein JW910_19855 [Anaerolineae bacterium]|nr:hypothetical protein [Anaerolineae bacterium]